MGRISIQGLGQVEIAGDTPTRDEATLMLEALAKLSGGQPDEVVLSTPRITRSSEGQLKMPLNPALGESFNIGRAVVKGARDLLTGALTFPFDVAGSDPRLSGPGGERAGH